jgi:glycosyltransferase involved in cell wall biosynthesis
VIPNGLDHTTFRPRNEQKTRRELGIPDGHNVVLFVAQSTTKHRKGFSLLAEALGALDVEDTTLLSVGGGEPPLSGNLPHVHAGRVEDDEALSRVYSLADIFVIPSRQDNLPNTVLESMACGTPVVGFNVGGIPDMVGPGETGWLAETGNVRELRQAIETALENDEEREWMGRRCREVVGEEYTLERQARQYRALYESVLNQQ